MEQGMVTGAAPQAPPALAVLSGRVLGSQNEMPRGEARKPEAHRLSEGQQVSEREGTGMVLHCADSLMSNQKSGTSPAGGLGQLLPPALHRT